MTDLKPIAVIYAKRVDGGIISIENVPKNLRDMVKSIIEEKSKKPHCIVV